MPKLSVIIPVYNECSTILKVIDKIKKADTCGLSLQIVIVDDFSTDGTRNILKKINDRSIKKIYHSINRGKGAAIRTGIKNSTGV